MPLMACISNEQLQAFYTIDRQLYHRMFLNLQIDPNLAKEALAFWLYLEETGCPNVVEKLSDCSNPVLNLVLQESHLCILYIHSNGDGTVKPPKNSTIPIFNGLLKFPLNLAGYAAFSYFHVQKILANTCERIIADNASPRGKAAGDQPRTNPKKGFFAKPAQLNSTERPSRFDSQAKSLLSGLNSRNSISLLAAPKSGTQSDEALLNAATVPGKERAMFLTFSRGFPLRKQELVEYFIRQFKRAVVERVLMPTRVGWGAPPLYARVVMESSEVVRSILRGRKKVKLVIEGF